MAFDLERELVFPRPGGDVDRAVPGVERTGGPAVDPQQRAGARRIVQSHEPGRELGTRGERDDPVLLAAPLQPDVPQGVASEANAANPSSRATRRRGKRYGSTSDVTAPGRSVNATAKPSRCTNARTKASDFPAGYA